MVDVFLVVREVLDVRVGRLRGGAGFAAAAVAVRGVESFQDVALAGEPRLHGEPGRDL